jgi:hypothetical protein
MDYRRCPLPRSAPHTARMDAAWVRNPLSEAERAARSAAAREHLCSTLAAEFRKAGLLLWSSGYVVEADRVEGRSPFGFGSDATVGLATVAQIAGELIAGAVLALEHQNVYSAAALARQLVEVECHRLGVR